MKYTNASRAKDVCITRPRLGRCRLNHYLKEMNLNSDGYCPFCNEAETIEHFLLKCKRNTTGAIVRELCEDKFIHPSLETILNNHSILNIIYRHLDRKL